MIALTDHVLKLKGSRTLTLNAKALELAKKHNDFLSLTVGEPDFTPPDCVIQAVNHAVNTGVCRYTAVRGRPELLTCVQTYFSDVRGLVINDDVRVLASTGSIQSIYNTLMATLEPGDEVLLPQPYWATYVSMIEVLGGVVVRIPTTAAQNYKVTPDMLAAHITKKSKWFIFNNPHNPTGVVYAPDEQKALGEVLALHEHVGVISDEIYALLVHDGVPCESFGRVNPQLRNRTVIVDGQSKCGALSGWRVGFAYGPSYLIDALARIQAQQTSNPSVISQVAAEALLANGFDYLQNYCGLLKERAAFMVAYFRERGIETSVPSGAYYILVNLQAFLSDSDYQNDDEAFVYTLMDKAHLCVTPGSYFGAAGHIRISLTKDVDVLGEAMKRLERYIS